MSIVVDREHAQEWQVRPGWGIAVDLTPSEVMQARQLKRCRQLIAVGLILVLTVCVGFSLLTRAERADAQRDYDRAQARTATLAGASDDFAAITAMQTVTSAVRSQLTVLMADDVDMVNLMARLRQAAPTGLTIDNLGLSIVPPADAAAVDPNAPAAGGAPLAGSTGQVIGSVTIAGTAATIDAVTPYVAALNRIPGTVDVLPTSISQGDTGASYTITLNVTDLLYTRRYQADGTAARPAETEVAQ